MKVPKHLERLVQYCQYIRNTAQVPLAAAQFDDDWEPIGPLVRRDLVNEGLITDGPDGLRLTKSGEALL